MKKISNYLVKIQKIINEIDLPLNEYEIYFRGESKQRPSIPGIFRNDFLQNEYNIFRELELRYPNIFDNAKLTIDKLAIMQHYGLPTRLLDFTTNPLLALYMAIDTTNLKDFSPRLKIIFVKKENIKYYDSDTISIFSNFSKIKNDLNINLNTYFKDNEKIEYTDNPRIMLKAGFRYLNWSNVNQLEPKNKYDLGKLVSQHENGELQYLLHEIKGEKPYFKDMIWMEHLTKSVIFVKPKHNSQRIINQAGLFGIFGLNEGKKDKFSLEDCESINDFKIKSLILDEKMSEKPDPTKNKFINEIKKSLIILGISYDKVYPEIEHSSNYIKEIYQ